jgi:hypothetical protein
LPDDADANLDDSAGQLIFLARTCVQVGEGSRLYTLGKGTIIVETFIIGNVP